MTRGLLITLAVICYLLMAVVLPWPGQRWPGELPPSWPDSYSSYVQNGYLTDAGADWVTSRTGMTSIPSSLEARYLSADAGGFMDQGDDTNDGLTPSTPWRSLYHAVDQTTGGVGGYIIYMDDADEWDVADDFGPAGCVLGAGDGTECYTHYFMSHYGGDCPNTRRSCWIMSDYDNDNTTGHSSSPAQTRPIIDVVTNSVDIGLGGGVYDETGMFDGTPNALAGDGWSTWNNIHFIGPIAGDGTGDWIAINTSTGGEGNAQTLGCKVTELKGNLNQLMTTHNYSHDTIVGINNECTIGTDPGGGTVSCYYGLDGGYYVIGNTITGRADSVAGEYPWYVNGKGGHILFVMDTTIDCVSGDSSSTDRAIFQGNPSDGWACTWTDDTRYTVIANTMVKNCDGAPDFAMQVNGGHTVSDPLVELNDTVKVFKMTALDNNSSVMLANSAHLGTQTWDADMRCNILDGDAVYSYQMDVSQGTGHDTISLKNLVDSGGAIFRFDPSNYGTDDLVRAAAPGDFPSQAAFDWDAGAASLVDANGVCNHADCLNQCDEVFTFRFPAGDYIPMDHAGFEYTGIKRNQSRNAHIGYE